MHILDKIYYLIENHQNFYWSKTNMEGDAVQLGYASESHVIFQYREEVDTSYLYRTIYTRFDQSVSKSTWPFSPPHDGKEAIKKLISLVRDRVEKGDIENRDDKLELINTTTHHINKNFHI